MMSTILLVVLGFVVLMVALSVRIVGQTDSIIVERMGQYHRTMKSGLNFMIPLVDRAIATTTSKDIILSLGGVDSISSDNAVIIADALIVIRVLDPQKAIYGVDDYQQATAMIAGTSLRSELGSMSLDEALSSREKIKANIQEAIKAELEDWGIMLRNIEIQQLEPSESMKLAMEEQAAAERQRKAAVIRAEGEKTAVSLQADAARYEADQTAKGRLDAAISDAAAQVKLAEATATAAETVGKALEACPAAAEYMLGEKFIANYAKLASSNNAKVVVMPADVMSTIGALLSKLKTGA